MRRCPHGEPLPLEVGDCCMAAQAAENELAHLQPVLEAVRRLDEGVFGCTAPLSFTKEGRVYLVAIHNALFAFDEAMRKKD